MVTYPLEDIIKLIEQGDRLTAQAMLEQILALEPHNLPVWSWYVRACATNEDRIKALELCLQYNPENDQVKQALEKFRSRNHRSQSFLDAKAQPETKSGEIILNKEVKMVEKISRLSKQMEFKKAFFGWFICANIIFSIIALYMMQTPPIKNGFILVVIGVWIPTAIFLMIWFGMGRIGAGIGVLFAVAVNAVLFAHYPISFSYPFLLPFPSAQIFFFFAVISKISPPYANLGHLMTLYGAR